jgi:hypothetical protein
VGSLERRGVLTRSEMQQMPTPGLIEKAALLERYSNSISTNANRPGGSDLNILVASLYCQKSTFIFVHVEVQKLGRDISQTKLMQGSLRPFRCRGITASRHHCFLGHFLR